MINFVKVLQNTIAPRVTGQSPFASSASDEEQRAARTLRVLIAEDDRDAAASLEALVHDEGHSTRCVYRGREVVGAAKDFEADVVLLDIGCRASAAMTSPESFADLRQPEAKANRRYGVEQNAGQAHGEGRGVRPPLWQTL